MQYDTNQEKIEGEEGIGFEIFDGMMVQKIGGSSENATRS